jgi:glucose-6-phosphate 1-dehydrogenase
VLAAAPAFAQDAAKPAWKSLDVTLEPRKMLEQCDTVEPGEKRRYHWKASAPVDFNIHYHQDNEAFYPVKRDAMRGDGGTFTAKTRQEYCWTWTARNAAARIEGQVETK